MLKTFLLSAVPLCCALPWLVDDDSARSDRAAVERAVTDYVRGFYEVKPELIERGVSPELVKYGYWRGKPEDEYRGMAMSFDQAKALAANWNEGGKQGDDLTYEVELLDVADKTAAAKLTAKWGIDYMHLSKVEGKWKIRHVMWQSPPPTE